MEKLYRRGLIFILHINNKYIDRLCSKPYCRMFKNILWTLRQFSHNCNVIGWGNNVHFSLKNKTRLQH